ncbi:MAG: carbohydrate ABC transporter permease [Lachnospiraceae bacterium]|nr:carbohydrate ABC transporter permease [Lachnospiraceae bacterium]
MSKKSHAVADQAALDARIDQLQKKYSKGSKKAREDVSMRLRMHPAVKVVLYIFLILMVFITVVPLLYAISGSFKTNQEVLSGINLIPKNPTFDNYIKVWNMKATGSGGQEAVNYATYTWNSIKVSLLTVVFTLFMTSLCAYTFQRGVFPGQKVLYWLYLGTMFVGAGTITIFPLLQLTTKLNMNNQLGLAILQSSVTGASNLFLTMGYLKTISKELDDAARIDGCSFVGTYFRVILPLSKPILATIALMAFRGSWNNYLMPRLMLAKPAISTLVVQVVKLRSAGGEGITQYNLMLTGTVFAAIPMILIFLFFNRWFIAGITSGAVKG